MWENDSKSCPCKTQNSKDGLPYQTVTFFYDNLYVNIYFKIYFKTYLYDNQNMFNF